MIPNHSAASDRALLTWPRHGDNSNGDTNEMTSRLSACPSPSPAPASAFHLGSCPPPALIPPHPPPVA